MQKKLIAINDNANMIDVSLNSIEGQMTFFGHLIGDMEKYPDGMALEVKHGITQKQLQAVYTLLNHQLQEIKKYQKGIAEISEESAKVNNG